MTSFDQTDLRILALLSKNARMSNKELAHSISLSPSSTHERLKRLQESGLLAGAHADVPLEQLGLPLKALLFIQMSEHEKGKLSSFLQEILKIPEVQAAWMISGRFDTMVELVARDTNHLHLLVVEKFSSREEVSRIETSVVFESIRRNDLSATLTIETLG
ncbi:possible transcriptional regulatory protein (probably lrp/asnc-family) [Roseobacter sp. SK209-2-6]|uniref:Lrp/AsnC family transcriptional regulator n=1 Tax=Roseobacter sp. SK209-2-6 TaxID=388739 RepID=UPI0000F3EE62|nr:Lrp/AsnC family transcriptional regulator [Roseobacter sp. SK209-2-6]EBA16702.1 possible transcriptional regulatory protein (probably lrp/asnc-family) [Roseobacter sp. SK209-2-6]